MLKDANVCVASEQDHVGRDVAASRFGVDDPVPVLVKTVSGITYRLVASGRDEADAWIAVFKESQATHDTADLEKRLTNLREQERRLNAHVENLAVENANLLDELTMTRARLKARDASKSPGATADTAEITCSWPTLACFDAAPELWNPETETPEEPPKPNEQGG